MKHLPWSDILDSLERGERPAHLNDCPDCENRWIRAGAMLSALAPEGQPPSGSEVLVMLPQQSERRKSPRRFGNRLVFRLSVIVDRKS